MQSASSFPVTQCLRNLAGLFALSVLALPLLAQDAAHAPGTPTPPKIAKQLLLFPDSVVSEQWVHTLKLVSAPQNLALLNPGQCIRVGIYATGDHRDSYLEQSKLSFRVSFAGKTEDHPPAPLAAIKQIKPEGGDFVTAGLAAANIKNPFLTQASLGASADNWCVPADAQDGSAAIEAEVESPDGHQKETSVKVQIESFATGSKRAFKDGAEWGAFLLAYYRQPNPARLLPLVQFLASNDEINSRPGVSESAAAFAGAALKADPVAARDFLARIGSQPPMTRALGLLILRSAGYDIGSALSAFSPEDLKKFQSLPPLDDPFDLTPTHESFTHIDMLWGVFGATGQFAPVEKIASALVWRSDYNTFDQLRKTPNHPTALTPAVVRGVLYVAAGWSLGSFQRNDPLVADYISYMLASPDTPQAIKTELAGLATNPIFKQGDTK
jgi:hypothetical protein